MPKRLTEEQVARFRRDGYLCPIRVMSEEAAAECRRRLEEFERSTGGPLAGELRHKTHLLFNWLADVVRMDTIVDTIEDLYGPDLLCWTTNFFIKEARSPAFVSWHQDSTYWGLSTPDVVTAWVAFTPANAANGAMSVIPGSHLGEQIAHRDTFGKDNLLSRGQEVAVEVDASQAAMLEMGAGEMSLHHVKLVHGSAPNTTDDRRIGLAIRYIPTHVRQLVREDSATLVRGTDRFGHFELEPPPKADLDPEMIAYHRRVTALNAAILFRDTPIAGHNDKGAVGLR